VDLPDLGRQWEQFARTDPYWAIWSVDEAADIESFYASGRVQVADLLRIVDNVRPVRRGAALDFGCGAGRLTRALASSFASVVGVDISTTMLDLARENTVERNVRYVLNDLPHLGVLDPARFDFVHTSITLQHMAPRFALTYLREFVRLLTPEGVAAFQVPPLRGRARLRRLMSPVIDARNQLRVRHAPVMEMHALSRREIESTLRAAGADLLSGSSDGWYIAARTD
jgi:SAM-dependent methyltransferase